MRVTARFLYWGVFLIAIGGVLVASELGLIATPALVDALRLWPLAVVAVGLGLVLRRTQLRVPAFIFAAAIPGLVLGAAFAVGPRFAVECGTEAEVANVATTEGTFDGPATVTVRSGCGSLDVTTAAGNGWRLDARNSAGRPPDVLTSGRSLSVDETSDHGVRSFDAGGDAWDLTLPTSDLERVSLAVTAGRSHVSLPGADVGRLALTVNAAEMTVDATEASVGELAAVVNVGSLSVRLPAASDITGSLRVGAGEVRICAPPGLGLRVSSNGMSDQVMVGGLQQTTSEWQSPGYASATHRADLTISSTFGAVEIDPIGGCS